MTEPKNADLQPTSVEDKERMRLLSQLAREKGTVDPHKEAREAISTVVRVINQIMLKTQAQGPILSHSVDWEKGELVIRFAPLGPETEKPPLPVVAGQEVPLDPDGSMGWIDELDKLWFGKTREPRTIEFTFILGEEYGEELERKVAEAGCDDALLSVQNGEVRLDFEREGRSIGALFKEALDQITEQGMKIARIETENIWK